MKISVIICTYNRCESLKNTLDSLLNQESDGSFNYEVIVVDNNSNDRTKEVTESYKERFNRRLRYVFETKQGLSYARNRGIEEARGEMVAFTDDDCVPEEKWLWKIYQEFIKDDQLDVVLGGAVWEDGKNMYSQNKILRGNGLNMSFRKAVFHEIGLFDIFLGSGSIGCSADDVEFIYRTTKRNKKVKLCEEIKVFHKHRISNSKVLEMSYRDCKGYVIFILKYLLLNRDILAMKKLYWFLSGTIYDLIKELRRKNGKRIYLKIYQLAGGIVGMFKGLYIWIVLARYKTVCQKSA